jgi:probable F420-dependent oxidoreductase
MRIGVQFPTTEIGTDLKAIQDFVQAAEELGYTHIRILDHVLGADPQFHPEVPHFPYTYESIIHEPFALMGYLAALTTHIELSTTIIILPQRQTALVAKQAAEVDVLSGGRLRLGLGVGWNPVEYETLGQNWHTRGARYDEQIEVLRLLWTQEVVSFSGKWHQIAHAGINPLPVQRPIPIWLGAGSSRRPLPPRVVLQRIACVADGWFPLFPLGDTLREVIARVHRHAREIGREPSTLGMEARFLIAGKSPDDWVTDINAWAELGATHISMYTSGAGFTSPRVHIDALRRFKDATGL